MLLVFTALIFMLNEIFLGLTDGVNHLVQLVDPATGDWNAEIAASTGGRFEGFSFTYLLAIIFAPVAWILGVPTQDITLVGQLLGLKTVINEFVAYDVFQAIRAEGNLLSDKGTLIATYALCGFSNFASIGIQIGGIGALAPGQRKSLTELGLKSLIAGTIACFLTGTLAGLFA
jgi:CNT family concentrative nucleoside transporter